MVSEWSANLEAGCSAIEIMVSNMKQIEKICDDEWSANLEADCSAIE